MSKSSKGHSRERSDRVMLYHCSTFEQPWSGDEARPSPALPPTGPLWERLASRLAKDTGQAVPTAFEDNWKEPKWKEGLPGLWYQVLSKDADAQRVTMLVRLEPGIAYPPHAHAGLEELYLLDGVLSIDDRKLHPGDYNRAEAGTGDERVWSATGCTCLLITSPHDVLK
jgi:putative transcriptional regulator